MANQAGEKDVYREHPTVTETFLMGQKLAKERLVSVRVCNLRLAFCSCHLLLKSLMHSFLSFNLASF